MTETKNYKLKKPGLSDPVDIEVLNENFDTIDKELRSFYDIFQSGDFRPTCDLSSKEEVIDVTEYIDYDKIVEAAVFKKGIRMWFNTSFEASCYALLTSIYSSVSNLYFCSLVSSPFYNSSYAEFVLVCNRSDRTISLRHYGDFPHRLLNDIKGEVVQTVNGNAPDENGNVEVATAGSAVVSGHTVVNGDIYTMTLTLEDGSTSVNVIETENGVPTKITVDGVEIPWTWEGLE